MTGKVTRDDMFCFVGKGQRVSPWLQFLGAGDGVFTLAENFPLKFNFSGEKSFDGNA
jgi:hypothetical protein